MTEKLNPGTYVIVVENNVTRLNGETLPGKRYVGRIKGYDLGHSKYEIDQRFMGWSEFRWLDGGSWAFFNEVVPITEAEAMTELTQNLLPRHGVSLKAWYDGGDIVIVNAEGVPPYVGKVRAAYENGTYVVEQRSKEGDDVQWVSNGHRPRAEDFVPISDYRGDQDDDEIISSYKITARR